MKNNKIYSKPKNGFCGAQNTPNKKDRVKNILSWLLIGILCLTMCGSLLGTIAFSKDCKTAKADSNLTFFNGSNVFIPTTTFTYNGINKGGTVLLYGDYYGGRYSNGSHSVSYLEPERISLDSDEHFTYYTPYEQISNKSYLGFNFSMQDIINSDGSISTNLAFFSIHTILSNLSSTDPYRAVSTNTYLNMSSDLVWRYPEIGAETNRDWQTTLTGAGSYLFAYRTFNDHSLETNFSDNGSTLCLLRITKTENFRSNIFKIEYGRNLNHYGLVGSEPFYTTLQSVEGKYYKYHNYMSYNYIRYYHSETDYIEFALPVDYNPNVVNYDLDSFLFQPRTYYVNGYQNNTGNTDISYQNGYNNALKDYIGSSSMEIDSRRLYYTKWLTDYKLSDSFYDDAYTNFYNDFIQNYMDTPAYKNAIDYAFEDGRIQGLTDSNNYNFTTMLSAAINAPLSAFKDMINFELLGVNLLGLFTGLFTVAFVLFVVRKLT